jgi:hypothetical protein
VTLPFVGAQVPMVRVRVGDGRAAKQMRSVARRAGSFVPPTDQLLYYGGLGLLALVGVVEWPVAALAGLGVFVASRNRHRSGPADNG